jgi:pyrimidine-nucleoside phosphorylase
MNILEVIEKKKYGKTLTNEEIDFFIQGYSRNEIPDYQISSLLMAIWFRGMNEEETANLTNSMVYSGQIIDLSKINGIKVDKHSSGGVADTVTLPLVAIIAANDIPVAKMSGRGLGHTGGTIDKLESIPGFKVEIPVEEFIEIVNRVKGAVISQSEEVALADKKLYALRDVTGTIDSIPLIASSIMSKKIASGSDAIVLDVKVGNGAFMQNLEDAIELSKTMVNIGNSLGKETVAYITDMNEPLGDAIGNAIEVEEAIEVLKGKSYKKLFAVIETLGAEIMRMAGKASDLNEGKAIVGNTIRNGAALKKFSEIVQAQGGNPYVINDMKLLPQAKFQIPLYSDSSGYLASVRTKEIGLLAAYLGAGREKKGDSIDLSVGIYFRKKIGDRIDKGEVIGEILANDIEKVNVALNQMKGLFTLSEKIISPKKVIYCRVSKEGIEHYST